MLIQQEIVNVLQCLAFHSFQHMPLLWNRFDLNTSLYPGLSPVDGSVLWNTLSRKFWLISSFINRSSCTLEHFRY
jgi:hypothetical protein